MNTSSHSFEVRPIRAIDLYKFCEIFMEAARTFEDNGESFWNLRQIAPHTILAHYRMDELFLAYSNNKPVAAMVFNNRCYWPELDEQQRRESLFVHKIAVARHAAGCGFAEHLLDWASEQSHHLGYSQLILLCNCQNPKLRKLWQSYGFTEVECAACSEPNSRFYIRSVDALPRLSVSKAKTPVSEFINL